MWIILNSLRGLISAIYPQVMLVSAKKKPWMFENFSIYLLPIYHVAIKSIFLEFQQKTNFDGLHVGREVNKS